MRWLVCLLFIFIDFREGGRGRQRERKHRFGFSFLKDFINFIFRLGEGREKERERNINVWLPLMHPLLGTWPITWACVLDWEAKQWPFGSQAGTQSTEPHQLGLFFHLFIPRWLILFFFFFFERDIDLLFYLCLHSLFLFLEREREIEIEICSTYLCIQWLLLCALSGDGTCNPGASGWRFNQLSYLARVLPCLSI